MMEGKIKLYSIPIDDDGFEFMTAVDVDDYDNLVAGAEALAAEVARLTADNAALRAQLDAAGWRPIHETLPPLGEEVQVRGRAKYVSSAWDVDLDEWRPAPPQE